MKTANKVERFIIWSRKLISRYIYISKIIYQVCNDHTYIHLVQKCFRVRVFSSLNSLNAAVLHLFFRINFQQNPIHINDISFVLQAFSKWNEWDKRQTHTSLKRRYNRCVRSRLFYKQFDLALGTTVRQQGMFHTVSQCRVAWRENCWQKNFQGYVPATNDHFLCFRTHMCVHFTRRSAVYIDIASINVI